MSKACSGGGLPICAPPGKGGVCAIYGSHPDAVETHMAAVRTRWKTVGVWDTLQWQRGVVFGCRPGGGTRPARPD